MKLLLGEARQAGFSLMMTLNERMDGWMAFLSREEKRRKCIDGDEHVMTSDKYHISSGSPSNH